MKKIHRRTDLYFLEKTFVIAREALGECFPNPHVGALVVKDEHVIAEGFHPFAGGEHAEAIVIRIAGTNAKGATLYSSLEPCSYHGSDKRTPPCTDRIISAGIARVVIGAIDPNPRENGRGIKILKRHGIEVTRYNLDINFVRQNEGYVCRVRNNRPLITLKWAQTADGFSADKEKNSRWISDDGALHFAHALRAAHSAVMIGSETALKDDPLLTIRYGLSGSVERIVLDRALKLPESLKLFRDTHKHHTTLIHSDELSKKNKLQALHDKGVRTVAVPDSQDEINLHEMLTMLHKENIYDSILIEGGASLIGSFITHNIWDKITIIVAPKIISGGAHIDSNPHPIDKSLSLELPCWYSLAHYKSQCMSLRGYRNCQQSFGYNSSNYSGAWHV